MQVGPFSKRNEKEPVFGTKGRRVKRFMTKPSMNKKALIYFISILLSFLFSCKREEVVYALDPEQNSNIVFVGNTFAVALQENNYLESLLYKSFPDRNLKVRNLAWSADEVNLQARPVNFGTLDQHLQQQKADVIFACFGLNEAFQGPDSLASFQHFLARYLGYLQQQKYNGHSNPQIILVSPIAHEKLGGFLPDPAEHNQHLKLYTQGMREVAKELGVPFIDLYQPTAKLMERGNDTLTSNGIHLTDRGFKQVSEIMAQALNLPFSTWRADPPSNRLRKAIAVKTSISFTCTRPAMKNIFTVGDESGLAELHCHPSYLKLTKSFAGSTALSGQGLKLPTVQTKLKSETLSIIPGNINLGKNPEKRWIKQNPSLYCKKAMR
jgi:hypothetical protein